MKCLCGFDSQVADKDGTNDYFKVISVNTSQHEKNGDKKDYIDFYSCPKCGTLKISL